MSQDHERHACCEADDDRLFGREAAPVTAPRAGAGAEPSLRDDDQRTRITCYHERHDQQERPRVMTRESTGRGNRQGIAEHAQDEGTRPQPKRAQEPVE